MGLRFYNTLARALQPFEPISPPAVTMYVCGPTVYDEPHIGHARSAYVFDVLRRYLAFKQFAVRFVRNVTDVDDKIIDKARQETEDRRQKTQDLTERCREVTERYLRSYHDAMDRLGISRPTEEPRATQHVVPDMTDCISKLLISGVAYEAGGDVYFAVRKFPGYGTLSHRTLDELQAGLPAPSPVRQAGARVEPGEHSGPTPARPGEDDRRAGGAGKQDPLDFALWKAAKPGEPSWNSPWGKGRPGWHLECSTMSTKYLGDAFDIHGGGVDLVFPHHENEIAQAQAVGKPFARCWIHNGLLTVKGEKMSKSLGNFITVDKALHACEESADILKAFFLGTHYRSPIDYAPENIKAATARFDRWFNVYYLGQYQPDEYEPGMVVKEIDAIHEEFVASMDDDLNTPRALAALDQLANLALQWHIDLYTLPDEGTVVRHLKGKIHETSSLIGRIGRELFGLTFEGREGGNKVRELANKLLQEREEARRAGNYRLADGIRERIHKLRFAVEDTPKGPRLVPRR